MNLLCLHEHRDHDTPITRYIDPTAIRALLPYDHGLPWPEPYWSRVVFDQDEMVVIEHPETVASAVMGLMEEVPDWVRNAVILNKWGSQCVARIDAADESS